MVSHGRCDLVSVCVASQSIPRHVVPHSRTQKDTQGYQETTCMREGGVSRRASENMLYLVTLSGFSVSFSSFSSFFSRSVASVSCFSFPAFSRWCQGNTEGQKEKKRRSRNRKRRGRGGTSRSSRKIKAGVGGHKHAAIRGRTSFRRSLAAISLL